MWDKYILGWHYPHALWGSYDAKPFSVDITETLFTMILNVKRKVMGFCPQYAHMTIHITQRSSDMYTPQPSRLPIGNTCNYCNIDFSYMAIEVGIMYD